MKTPKVSVILPMYNVAAYLPKCIDHLINQTLKDIEIIFVDDCSPDNSADIVKSYNDPRIKLIRHKVNKYTAEARNSGINAAKGEYLSFMDPDDWPALDFLEKLYTLAKKEDADIAKGTMTFMPMNTIWSRNTAINKNKFNFHFMHQSAIYKRKMIIDNNIRFSIDVICGQFPMIYYANKIVTCEDATYYYLKRLGSCVNQPFSIEKWEKLNIAGANLVLDFINTHEISQEDYSLVARTLILNLYQYGYNRMLLSEKEIAKPKLNKHLDNFWENIKYPDDSKLLLTYQNVRLKYA